MSPIIEQFADQASLATVREFAWQRIGTVTGEAMTAEQALSMAHLDGWDVRKEEAYTLVNGEQLAMPRTFAIVRNNPFYNGENDRYNVLGTVGKDYVPTQNEEHAEFLNTLVDASGAHFEAAMSLNDGRRVVIVMKLPNTVQVGGVDPVDTFVMAQNSHDGNSSFEVITTMVRLQCTNMLAAAFRGAPRRAKVRHTAGQGGAIARVREQLEITFKYASEFEVEVERMVQESLTKSEFEKITAQLFPVADSASDLVKGRIETHRANVRSLFEESGTMDTIKGTRWAGYNAVTEYLDHFVQIPGKRGNGAQADARALKAIEGKTDAVKEQAFQLLAV